MTATLFENEVAAVLRAETWAARKHPPDRHSYLCRIGLRHCTGVPSDLDTRQLVSPRPDYKVVSDVEPAGRLSGTSGPVAECPALDGENLHRHGTYHLITEFGVP